MIKAVYRTKRFRSGIYSNSTCNCGTCNCNCGSQLISTNVKSLISKVIK